jgi:hypothetical protein
LRTDIIYSQATWRRYVDRVSLLDVTELVFLVEEAPEGGFTARALGPSIFTEADTLDQLHAQVRDAVTCHFEDGERPKVIRLHYVRDELLAV